MLFRAAARKQNIHVGLGWFELQQHGSQNKVSNLDNYTAQNKRFSLGI